MLASDLMVIAGHPVPTELRPPERDRQVVREFAYRVTFCDHSQMGALKAFVHTLPTTGPHIATLAEPVGMRDLDPDASRLATILRGLLHNRGFGPRELPFVVLASLKRSAASIRHHAASQVPSGGPSNDGASPPATPASAPRAAN